MTQRTIHEWILHVNTELSKLYGLKKPMSIIEEDYGYETYKAVIINLLSMFPSNHDIKDIENFIKTHKEDCIQMMHNAWCDSYIRFKNSFYTKATNDVKKGIHTHERNERATCFVNNLSEEDKSMYEDILNIIVSLTIIDIVGLSLSKI